MTSRMDELEDLIISGRKPARNIIKAIQRRFAGKDKLTNTEKRKLQALKRRARKSVDIENMFRDAPVLEFMITEGNLSEPFDRKNIKTAKPKKKPIRSQGSAGARDRADTKTAKPPKRESSVKDVAPLGGSSYEIKKGDTLSAIARLEQDSLLK